MNKLPDESIRNYYYDISELIKAIWDAGAMPVLTTHANRFPERREDWTATDKLLIAGWRRFYLRASEKCIISMEKMANYTIIELGKKFQVPVVDLASIVPRKNEYFADMVHFTDEGEEIVASSYTQVIMENADYEKKSSGSNQLP